MYATIASFSQRAELVHKNQLIDDCRITEKNGSKRFSIKSEVFTKRAKNSPATPTECTLAIKIHPIENNFDYQQLLQ